MWNENLWPEHASGMAVEGELGSFREQQWAGEQTGGESRLPFVLWSRLVLGLIWELPLRWAYNIHIPQSHMLPQTTLGGSLYFTASKPSHRRLHYWF